jgi:hypothetical protein
VTIKINGRVRYYDHLSDFAKLSPSRYAVRRNATEYTIEGGKRAGGTAREWFVDASEWTKPIFCTSLVDALNLLDRM